SRLRSTSCTNITESSNVEAPYEVTRVRKNSRPSKDGVRPTSIESRIYRRNNPTVRSRYIHKSGLLLAEVTAGLNPSSPVASSDGTSAAISTSGFNKSKIKLDPSGFSLTSANVSSTEIPGSPGISAHAFSSPITAPLKHFLLHPRIPPAAHIRS